MLLLPSCLLFAFVLSSAALPARHTFPNPRSFKPTRRACNSASNILFDGRMAPETKADNFDADTSVFDNNNVKGQNQTFANIIQFPDVDASLFDAAAGTKAFSISLSDASIFLAGEKLQTGFRRTEVIPRINNDSDETVQGITTVHWSLRSSSSQPLNLSHENQLVFHEVSDFSTNQFMLKTGTPMGQTFVESEHKTLRLEGRQTAPELIFSTPFEDNVWHNFAITIAWDSVNFTVHYSKDMEPLQVVNATTNDNSGKGQQHFGILKLPTGDTGIDVTTEGFQESGISNTLIYGGIFTEDSSDGHVSLS